MDLRPEDDADFYAMTDPAGTGRKPYSVFRRNAEFLQVGQLHPVLRDALRDLDARRTGEFISWPDVERDLVSGPGDVLRINELGAWRSPEQQEDLYAQGRVDARKGPIVTKARAYQSYHNWGCAVDLVVTRYGFGFGTYQGQTVSFNTAQGWIRTGIPQFLESRGLTWGGRWTDFPDYTHFEYRTPVPVDDAFAVPGWWDMDVPLVGISQRKPGQGMPWVVVVASLAGGYYLLKKKR